MPAKATDQKIRDYLLVVFFGAIVLFTNLGGIRLWDRDEPRNAGCALEMMQRGDWVVPVFNAELRTHKPILLYWLMIAAYKVFGINEFAARFWSAACGIGTMLATYHIGRRLFDASAGRWAAIVLGSTLMFDVAARAATPDSILIFFSTLGIMFYVLGTMPPRSNTRTYDASESSAYLDNGFFPSSLQSVACLYACFGLAILAKGPVGIVLPMSVIGMFMLWMRISPDESSTAVESGKTTSLIVLKKLAASFAPCHFLKTLLAMRPMMGISIALAVALPWYVWVGIRTDGAWLQGFFLEHNFGRAMRPLEGHGGGPLYYPLALLVGFFPWSVFAIPIGLDVVRGSRRDQLARIGTTLCLCWLGVYVVLFSLARTKLPSYITPAYPAAALLTGSYLSRLALVGSNLGKNVWLRVSWCTLAAVGAAITVGLTVAASQVLPGEYLLGLVGLIPVVGGLMCLRLHYQEQGHAALRCTAATALLFCTSVFAFGAARVDKHQKNDILLRAIWSRSHQPQIAAFGRLEPSWVYYGGRPIRFIGTNESAELCSFLHEDAQHFAITTKHNFDQIDIDSRSNIQVIEEVPYFLRKTRLVLIGLKDSIHTASKKRSDAPFRE